MCGAPAFAQRKIPESPLISLLQRVYVCSGKSIRADTFFRQNSSRFIQRAGQMLTRYQQFSVQQVSGSLPKNTDRIHP